MAPKPRSNVLCPRAFLMLFVGSFALTIQSLPESLLEPEENEDQVQESASARNAKRLRWCYHQKKSSWAWPNWNFAISFSCSWMALSESDRANWEHYDGWIAISRNSASTFRILITGDEVKT